jgi:dihydropteroate synthase
MPIVRFVQSESEELVRLHLVRVGARPNIAAASAREGARRRALVTGLGEGALDGLPRGAGFPEIVSGDGERASGSALITGARASLERLARAAMAQEGACSDLGEALLTALATLDAPPVATQIGQRRFLWGSRTFLMAVLNVTPDSFSDGGCYPTPESAVAAGERLAAEGADLLDVGGESTRPGAAPVSAQEEIDRVVPVIDELARRLEVPISIDTTKAAVAEAAVHAGASLVNDISGFTFDSDMAPAIARLGATACAMHIQGVPRSMQASPTYFDVVGEVMELLQAALDHGERCGIPRERILVDPGVGFGKTAAHNLFLLRNLAQLKSLGRPVLVGASRKSFIGAITGKRVGERLPGSLAVLSAAILGGADVVRVHDLAESAAAARMVDALARAQGGGFAFETSG